MPQQKVEIVRAMFEAFNRGDVEMARDALHPDAELHQPPEVADANSYYGREDFARGLSLWLSAFDDPRFEILEASEVDDRVIMRIGVSGKGRASGINASAEFFHLWTLRDGQPYQCFVRSSRAEAIRALELTR